MPYTVAGRSLNKSNSTGLVSSLEYCISIFFNIALKDVTNVCHIVWHVELPVFWFLLLAASSENISMRNRARFATSRQQLNTSVHNNVR